MGLNHLMLKKFYGTKPITNSNRKTIKNKNEIKNKDKDNTRLHWRTRVTIPDPIAKKNTQYFVTPRQRGTGDIVNFNACYNESYTTKINQKISRNSTKSSISIT